MSLVTRILDKVGSKRSVIVAPTDNTGKPAAGFGLTYGSLTSELTKLQSMQLSAVYRCVTIT